MKAYVTPGAVASALALIIMIITSIALAYIFFIEKPSLRYMNLPFPVLKSPVYAGDVLPLMVTRCSDAKTRRVVTASRYLEKIGGVDELLAMNTIAAVIPPGCVTQIVKIHRVPDSTTPGDYRLRGSTTVRGLIQYFDIEWYSEPFEVVTKPVTHQQLKTPP